MGAIHAVNYVNDAGAHAIADLVKVNTTIVEIDFAGEAVYLQSCIGVFAL